VLRLKELGADGIKILLSYDPEGDAGANDEKKTLIERIGAECESAGVPFFLEPVVYDETGADVRSAEFARRKPGLVIRTMAEFSQPRYKVDVLKVEFPVSASRASGEGAVFTRAEALALFREADAAACGIPYIYLSAGVSITEFVGSLRLAAESGARFRGVLCGRANWQDGVPAYARGGIAALEEWLARDGVRNIQAVNECLPAA
jgi:tagatose 1,6-diphosphate aldolase